MEEECVSFNVWIRVFCLKRCRRNDMRKGIEVSNDMIGLCIGSKGDYK